MASENYVAVELIANPSVKRMMNVNSFRVNQNKWRLQEGQDVAGITQQTQKKKDVEPADNTPEKPLDITSPDFDMNAAVNAALPQAEVPQGQLESIEAGDQELEKLRALYKEKFGKDADSRWKVSRLTKEING